MKTVNLKEKEGVTILALSITIIILLILAGITITALTGENGLIKSTGEAKKSTGEAKKETEIANEKEILERATTRSNGTGFKRNCKRRKFKK